MRIFIDAGLALLPADMDSLEARAFLYAIAFQESGFHVRKQSGGGPARSFFQFEPIGVEGVMEHPASKYFAQVVLGRLFIEKEDAFEAITFSDALAPAFARLNLWRLPDDLPKQDELDKAWWQYIKAWGPGKPRLKDWDDNFKRGWEIAISEEKKC